MAYALVELHNLLTSKYFLYLEYEKWFQSSDYKYEMVCFVCIYGEIECWKNLGLFSGFMKQDLRFFPHSMFIVVVNYGLWHELGLRGSLSKPNPYILIQSSNYWVPSFFLGHGGIPSYIRLN